MWNIFRLSTCHRMVHCDPLICLLAMQLSYGFNSKPCWMRYPLRSFQNSKSAWSVLYSAFASHMYITSLPFLVMRNLVYLSGSTLVSTVANGPLSFTWITSSMLVCMKAPGMSQVATFWCSFISKTHDRNRDSMERVGVLVSSLLVLYTCFFCPYAHPCPLIHPHHFCFRNTRYWRDHYFSCCISMFTFFSMMTPLPCSCCMSIMMASVPALPNSFKPF